MRVPTVLIDNRNFDQMIDKIEAENAAASILGFDIETFDDAHPGIIEYRDADTVLFDNRRTTVAGFSTFVPDSPQSYYINLNHADVANRVPWNKARRILDVKPKSVPFIIHNDPFERTMMKNSLGFDVGDTIDTMQLAVSAFGPDEYEKDDFGKITTWPAINFVPQIVQHFQNYDKRVTYELTPQQAKLLGQIVAKESKAAHSYNGFNKSIAFGYGLKQLVRNFLKEDIGDFKALLAKYDAKDMRDLTGEQVADYGGDDSYFAVQIFYKIMERIRPEAMKAFEEQENPMNAVYSSIWQDGCHVDRDAVDKQYEVEKAERITQMAALKSAVQTALPFPDDPNAELLKREEWYQKNWKKYREWLVKWDNGSKGKKALNLMHYMPMRVMLYDLFGLPLVIEKSKLQSDGDARGKMRESATGAAKDGLTAINALSGIDQRVKLYLEPYRCLIDPETQKIYPQASSQLATRRMSMSFPNPQQLQKQGTSTYIRGFYLPDDETDLNPYRRRKAAEFGQKYGVSGSAAELWQAASVEEGDLRHGIMSIDLSQIELVLIGEFSGDEAFKEAYGQLPYKDLHQTAGAAILAAVADCPDFSREDFVQLKLGKNVRNIPLFDAKGEELSPAAAYKYNRGNAGGKGANFEYWYSGALSTLAERRGLAGGDQQKLVQAYADAFPQAVGWRQDQAMLATTQGFLELPDGHRRVRFEATMEWQAMMMNFWRSLADGMGQDARHALTTFGEMATRKISRRGQNQLINAMIQGTCAAIIKRSIIRVMREVMDKYDIRFMFPIHDELVFSCRYDHMLEAMNAIQPIMATHPDIVKNLIMNSSVSIGRTFQPFDPDRPDRVPFGQIELAEAPALPFVPEKMIGKPMDEATILATIEYLRNGK